MIHNIKKSSGLPEIYSCKLTYLSGYRLLGINWMHSRFLNVCSTQLFCNSDCKWKRMDVNMQEKVVNFEWNKFFITPVRILDITSTSTNLKIQPKNPTTNDNSKLTAELVALVLKCIVLVNEVGVAHTSGGPDVKHFGDTSWNYFLKKTNLTNQFHELISRVNFQHDIIY